MRVVDQVYAVDVDTDRSFREQGQSNEYINYALTKN